MIKPKLPEFNREIADTFLRAGNAMAGLPGFLGIELVDAEAGTLRARMPVTDKLLTPFGNIHGECLQPCATTYWAVSAIRT